MPLYFFSNRASACYSSMARLFLVLLFLTSFSLPTYAISDLGKAGELLMSSSFDDKSEALQLLASENNPDTKEVLKLLGDGQLFYHKKDKQLFIVNKSNDYYKLFITKLSDTSYELIEGEELILFIKK